MARHISCQCEPEYVFTVQIDGRLPSHLHRNRLCCLGRYRCRRDSYTWYSCLQGTGHFLEDFFSQHADYLHRRTTIHCHAPLKLKIKSFQFPTLLVSQITFLSLNHLGTCPLIHSPPRSSTGIEPIVHNLLIICSEVVHKNDQKYLQFIWRICYICRTTMRDKKYEFRTEDIHRSSLTFCTQREEFHSRDRQIRLFFLFVQEV